MRAGGNRETPRHARQVAAQAGDLLKHYVATTTIWFGSVSNHTFNLDSDLDLAGGMPAENWWHGHHLLSEVFEFQIAFVNRKRIQPGFYEIITQCGVVLDDAAKRHSDAKNANCE